MCSLLDAARRQLFLCLALLVVVSLPACQRAQDQPELLVVADVSPRRLELGDRLEVVGDGFPEGRPARVELQGELHRAGDPTVRQFRHSFVARSQGRNMVSFVPEANELQQIVGVDDAAAHTTFRGSVRVAFGSQNPATGPVFGSLEDVVIDFFPWDVPARVQRDRVSEAQRFSSFLGVQLGKGGYEVALVKPGSRAEAAGIKGGDRLLSLDQVNLLTETDFAASGAGPRAGLSLQRGRLQTPIELVIEVEGFRPISAERLAGATLLVGFVAALWLLFCAPMLRLLIFLERQVVRRYKEARQPRAASSLTAPTSLRDTLLGFDMLPGGVLGSALRPLSYLIFLAVSSAFATLSMGQSLVGRDLDVPLLFLSAGVLGVCAQAMGGGLRQRGGWSLREGGKAALIAVVFQVPAALALATVFVRQGSLSAAHVVSGQGIAPWDYHLFASPMLAVACVGLLLSVLPDGTSQAPAGRRAVCALVFHIQSIQLLVVCGLCALLFLGGYGLSNYDAPEPPGTLSLLAGAALLQLKMLLLVAAVVVLRWLLVRVSARALLGYWIRWLLPLSLISFMLCLLNQGSWLPDAHTHELQRGVRWVMLLLGLSGIGFLTLRVLRRLRGGAPKLTAYPMNPWL